MATTTKTINTKKKDTVSAGSSKKNKQLTVAELREWYAKNTNTREAMQLLDPSKNASKTFNTFSKETLRTYMKNPLSNSKNLRNLSRFLYYRSHTYRRIINYYAEMIDLNMRSVIPLVDLIKGVDKESMIKAYYDTLILLQKMNLPLEFLKAYITCFREDVFYGCAYFDDETFFILPLPADYCQITSIYNDGSLGFNMDMTYFSQRKDILEMWGSPFIEMYREYEKDTVNNRWVPIPDENCVCLKQNIDDLENNLPPFMALFDSLINLEDLKEITAISDEQQIYKLLLFSMPLLKNSDEPDDWAVSIETIIEYYNKVKSELPDYTDALLSPVPVEQISFDHDSATDVNRVENATKNVLSSSGGANVLVSGTGATSINLGMLADENTSISSLLPQTQAIINRLISYRIKNAAFVKFLEVTTFTKQQYRDSLLKMATYGVPVKTELGVVSGFNELELISKAHLEQAIGIQDLYQPLKSSNTMNTGNIDNPEGGRPKNEVPTDDSEASEEKRERNG